MSFRRCGALLPLILTMALVHPCLAQDRLPPHHVWYPRWVTVSVGLGSPPRTALLLSYSLHTPVALLSLRLAGNFGRHEGPSEGDFGLLAMKSTNGKHWLGVVGAGLAIVGIDDGHRGYLHPINPHSAPGLPLEVQGLWCPDREVGISLTGFANLNGRRSFAGLTLGAVWGVFWPGHQRARI